MVEQILHRIKLHQAEIGLALAQGQAVTFEAYQRMVGEYQGLTYVLDQIDDLLRDDNE